MAITSTGENFKDQKFNPEIFSKKTLANFYLEDVCSKICNTDYEGELSHGHKCNIRRKATLSLTPYIKNSPRNWTDVVGEEVELSIDYAWDANAKIDVVDKKQFDIDVMTDLQFDLQKKMSEKINSTIVGAAYSSAYQSYDSGNAWSTAGNPMKDVAIGIAKLQLLGIPMSEMWIMLDPISSAYLKLEQGLWATNAGTSQSAIKSGEVGTLHGGVKVYTSAHVTGSGTNGSEYNCMIGHKSAITMATQIQKVKFFDDIIQYNAAGVSGLVVMGFQVVQPKALLHLKVQV